jgi:DNA-binding response OmpR family regulator
MGPASPVTAGRVLVVDDDDYVRDVTGMILEEMGYRVRTTRSGFEALRWLGEESYDLLVLDVKMPEVDGPSLYRAVRARWSGSAPRVLFVSGFSEAGCHADGLIVPPDVPVLFKPFTVDELQTAIDRVLATA